MQGIVRVKFTIQGDALLMHNGQLADVTNEYAIGIDAIKINKKTTAEDRRKREDLEWMGGLHLDAEGKRPVIPGHMLRACLRDGAKTIGDRSGNMNGKNVQRALSLDRMEYPISSDGPSDIKKRMADPRCRHMAMVAVKGSRIRRVRPLFRNWSIAFTAMAPASNFEPDQIVRVVEAAGMLTGLGDFRPDKGGDFGRFEVVSSEVLDAGVVSEAAE